MTKTQNTIEKAVRRLESGDKVLSASGNTLTVTNVIIKENRAVVLFDGDREVDMDPYMQVKVIEK
jgi:hypothetical protein